MAKRTTPNGPTETTHYKHEGATRKNIPAAAMAAEGKLPKAQKVKYAYSPHLDPVLRFDSTGRADKVAAIVDKACRGERLDSGEQQILKAVGRTWEEPWLEWANKQEEHARHHFDVEPVALHIHERISAQAILRHAMRKDAQRSLFADPEQAYSEALQFYKHDVDWANRLILGDSLQVMSSLVQRENLGGRVQVIYVDPPYGISFGSNFQPEIGRRDVRHGNDHDLTREPEMVRAYRDTWTLGTSSYLSYLKARLRVSRELLTASGSVFVQISDDNVHRVRLLLDEIFGAHNFVAQINFKSMGALGQGDIPKVFDYILWYAKDVEQLKFRRLYREHSIEGDAEYRYIDESRSESEAKVYRRSTLTSSGFTVSCTFPFELDGRRFSPFSGKSWRTNRDGMGRLAKAERLFALGSNLYYKRFAVDSKILLYDNSWADAPAAMARSYVVETAPKFIERCLLMTSDPGDLVLDPTCGSGTTAFVAEQWGRRWITIDTSRVSVALARRRLLTAKFAHYRTKARTELGSLGEDPGAGLVYRTSARITLGSVAQNTNLDPIFAEHEPILLARLQAANEALTLVPESLRARLTDKLKAKETSEGSRAVTDADRRRWLLPPRNRAAKQELAVDATFQGWYEWEVPFDTDPDYPQTLQDAVIAYRIAWRAKMDDVNRCIEANAEQEALVDKPEVVRGVVRVSGPFTVEGVIPEELSLSEDGAVDLTTNEFEAEDAAVSSDPQNLSAYLSRMVSHLRSDGLTFLNNQRRQFEHLEALFEEGSGSFLHAEGHWKDEPGSRVAVTFGPQHGPVTALQVEEAIRAARQYTELVIAGFSFDAETYAIVEQQQHPRLRIHLAQIRPDLNEAMDGLLKNTPNSQLFTVFGQPDVTVTKSDEGWVCSLIGVDIYNPTDNTLRSTGADKVAAWFLDSDYDGRCFCATQAFFPNQDAWDKIARALGGQANEETFEAFSGTTSLPFEKGKYARIAVKVIDPRGNEVMAIRRLQD